MEKERLELENLVDTLFDKDSFFLELFSGAVIPVTHPNYYNNRLEIKLIESNILNEQIAKIEGTTYEITNEKNETIKKVLIDNFSNLINIALKQGTEMFVGGGTTLNIKIKSVHIMIDCNNVNNDDKEFVNFIIEKIVNIIKN